MREIKFRAWDNYNKRMIIEPFKITIYLNGVVELHTANYLTKWDALMQYTGLKDKNGVEIYEGDLVKDSDSDYIGQVIFDEESLCFTTKFQNNELWGFIPRHGKDNHCEVIGNIYENPELLGGSNNQPEHKGE